MRARRSKVGAWLTGDASDARVLLHASIRGTVVKLFGSEQSVINAALASRISVVYSIHVGCQSRFAARGIEYIGISNASRIHSANFLALGAVGFSSSVPILKEMSNGSVSQYFDEGNSSLKKERIIEKRSFVDQLWEWIKRVYLPCGYPSSVTQDYLRFTQYRALQNLASAIMTVISTEALLFGLGLGKKVAAGAAATNWVLKDGASHLAKILYGCFAGTKFDSDPKAWRVTADITEDIGMGLDVIVPLFPGQFLLLASIASVLKGISAMTGTATRHVVYRSLAAPGQQNIGDIATKGESQGVTLKMLGLGAGIFISSQIGQNYKMLLLTYSAFSVLHLAANWRSLSCVEFNFLNKQRFFLTYQSFLRNGQVPPPSVVKERIILPPWRGFEPFVRVGAPVKSSILTTEQLKQGVKLFGREKFIITISPVGKINVLLKHDSTPKDTLRAYYTIQSYLHTRREKGLKRFGHDDENDLKDAYGQMRRNVETFLKEARKAGWDTENFVLTDGQARVAW